MTRARLTIALALLIPFGLAVKYLLPCAWCRAHGGALLYNVFWVLLAGWWLPRARPAALGSAVLAATVLLEVSQLWQPRGLQVLRATGLGAALLGTTFDPADFPYYLAGSALGALALHRARRGPAAS